MARKKNEVGDIVITTTGNSWSTTPIIWEDGITSVTLKYPHTMPVDLDKVGSFQEFGRGTKKV